MQISPSSPGCPVSRVDQRDRVARQRPAHRAGLERLARRVADLRRRLGLPVAVAQRQPPGAPDLLDHLGVQRLAGADDLAQRRPRARQVRLDEHPPDRRRRAERRHLAALEHAEQRRRVEALVVVDEHGRLGQPGREEVAPGVLGPAGRGQVEVHVAGLQPEPVQRRQVADRIRRVRVLDELRPRRRAGGEVQQQRVVRAGRRRRARTPPSASRRVGVGQPAVDRLADRDPRVRAGHVRPTCPCRPSARPRAWPCRARSGRAGRPARAASSPG